MGILKYILLAMLALTAVGAAQVPSEEQLYPQTFQGVMEQPTIVYPEEPPLSMKGFSRDDLTLWIDETMQKFIAWAIPGNPYGDYTHILRPYPFRPADPFSSDTRFFRFFF